LKTDIKYRLYVGFLVAVKEALENPLNFLMDGEAKKALEL
jgi:2-oxoglutarate dehydrogenase E2 component (dihydrolipoamide succinyltransferase)